jgi:hypothetical protein
MTITTTTPKRTGGRPRVVKDGDAVKLRKGESATAPLEAREAKALLRETDRKLTAGEVTSELLPDLDCLRVVKSIALGTYSGDLPPREIVAAARLMMEYTLVKPVQAVDIRAVTIHVVNGYDLPDEAEGQEVTP